MTLLLKASKIKKTFSSPSILEVLKGIDLEVKPGEAVAITGKSGEGKTTLLHILGTLEPFSEGSLFIAGEESCKTSLPSLRCHQIGFVFQQSYLLEEETLLFNILMPARIARRSTHPHSPAYNQALERLAQVNLQDKAHVRAGLLSGGEKQRAALVRALCNNPPLILADEPSGNLDATHSGQIYQLLLDLTRNEGKSLIAVTHDLEFARLCDRHFLLKGGHLNPVNT